MHESKVVWLVGAGGSISDSSGHYPALASIPTTAKKLEVLKNRAAAPGFACLRQYIKTRFGRDLSKGPKLDLESVLTLLEIDLESGSDPSHGLARHDLLELLRETFLALGRGTTSSGHYRDLANNRLGPADTVITFNWDTRLDDLLGRLEALSPSTGSRFEGPYGHFVTKFTALGDSTVNRLGIQKPYGAWDSTRGFLLKAHGSIDWFQCINTACRNHGALFPQTDSAIRPMCGWCFERLEIVLVPPTLNKRLRSYSRSGGFGPRPL